MRSEEEIREELNKLKTLYRMTDVLDVDFTSLIIARMRVYEWVLSDDE